MHLIQIFTPLNHTENLVVVGYAGELNLGMKEVKINPYI